MDTDNGKTDENLNGKLLHKVEDNAMEFFGPVTIVNGKIWSYYEVESNVYRVRLINGSNARIYRLLLIDEKNQPVNDIITLIGSNGGLLSKPIPFKSNEGITIASAERVDILMDFNKLLKKGSKDFKFVNTIGASCDDNPNMPNGYVIGDDIQIATYTIYSRLKYPNVIKFVIKSSDNGHGQEYTIPHKL